MSANPNPWFPVVPNLTRYLLQGGAALLLAWVCWSLVAPFLPAVCWAFALALIAHPAYLWLLRKKWPADLAALTLVLATAGLLVGPGAILGRALAAEASEVVSRMSGTGAQSLRAATEQGALTGPIFHWLDARYDLAAESAQLIRSVASWAAGMVRPVLSGSIWLFTQLTITLFVLFYFLRDGLLMVATLKSFTPLSPLQMDAIGVRVAQTVRISLGVKLLEGVIQGTLGGLMFAWLGLPAPVFWGAVMVFFSIFPILGAFVVWAPAALLFALGNDWPHALLLTVWGVVVIHPVDNLLGPMLVGTTLKMHTLLMFFSVVGGLAAFGASGIVLGPVAVAVAVALHESSRSLNKQACETARSPNIESHREAPAPSR